MLVGACALTGQDSSELTTYLLEWSDPVAEAPSVPTPCAAVLVTSPLSAPGYGTARMAYTQQDHRLDYFATTRWADTPARMLSPLLTRALQTSGLFKAAVESPAPIDAQLRLESELLKLRQVFSDKASSVELSMKFTLYDLMQGRVLASRMLSVTEPSPSRDPYGGVIAANRAVDRMLTQLANFLAQVLVTQPLDCG